ncbi:Ribosomal protein L11 methyltransferase [bioreactor metagenome]|uniref:Ribosomal protein L11 methyltransferase n=1 Tax=bioreactor metagenome TaxID=1076179 RepID=A0A645D4R1_9ZZZZ
MNWKEVKIETSPDSLEALCDALVAQDILSFEVEDPNDFEAFLKGEGSRWDYIDDSLMGKKQAPPCVKVYLPDNEQGQSQLALIREGVARFDRVNTRIITGDIREEDWANNWKAYYKPVFIANRLVIWPVWQELSSLDPDTAVVLLDPGMAFGTGTHETTRLCLSHLCECLEEGQTVLDIGCGSGILSIAALKLGAEGALGIDIDEMAAGTARKNAAINGLFAPRFQSEAADIISDRGAYERIAEKKYDLILANIVADVILPLFPLIPPLLLENGRYIVSGIIADRRDEVLQSAQNSGFTLLSSKAENDWESYVFGKSKQQA